MKPLGSIALATVLGLGGCVAWKSTDLTHIGSNSTLTRSVKVFGLILDPHNGFQWGSGDIIDGDAIQFYSTKDHYTEAEFDIVDPWDGKLISDMKAKTGTVNFDRKAHTVFVAIYINGRPYKLNGRHSYKDKNP